MIVRGLLGLSSLVFAVTGLAYLGIPGVALGIVGVESSPTSDFLLRTEGAPCCSVPPCYGRFASLAIVSSGSRYSRSPATTS